MLGVSPRIVRRVGEVVRGLWLTPVLMALAGVALGIAGPLVDRIPGVYGTLSVGWIQAIFDSGASGARALLAAAAGALATILGVAFSLTLVTLQLAAAQYTTRVIGRFTDDRVTKLVLGTYIGSVAYLLLVLRAIHEAEGEAFVPRLSVALGVVLFLACLGLLAYFLNHLGGVIQASSIVTAVAKRTLATLEAAPGEPGDGPDPAGAPVRLEASTPGYVQIVDLERAARAVPKRSHVRLDVSPGDFVVPGLAIASVWPSGGLTEEERGDLASAISIGHVRTEDQDVLMGVQRLSDIALKALSPSVNDETTAILALNELGVVALAVAHRAPGPGDRRVVRAGGTTVTLRDVGLGQVLETGLRGPCRFSVDHPRVLARIAELLVVLAEQSPGPGAPAALARAAGWVRFALDQSTTMADERAAVEERLAALADAHAARREEGAAPPLH